MRYSFSHRNELNSVVISKCIHCIAKYIETNTHIHLYTSTKNKLKAIKRDEKEMTFSLNAFILNGLVCVTGVRAFVCVHETQLILIYTRDVKQTKIV